MIQALARVSWTKIRRTPRTSVPILIWAAFSLALAWATRAEGLATGASHALETYGAVFLPLFGYAAVSATLAGDGLKRAIRGVVTLGVEPLAAASSSVAVAVAVAVAFGAVFGAVVAGLAHGIADPSLASDLFVAFWVGGLGAGAYAAFFMAGSVVGKGTGRAALLIVDWLIGGGSGALSLLCPRSHITSLLGGPLAADVSQRASSVLLLVLLGGYGVVAVAASRRG